MRRLPSRQIHLDFHTSPLIPDVGATFDESSFIETLKDAHVNSVTLFAKCHHGYSYHDTKVGERHPNLKTDLLRRQYDACKAAGIATPIYVSIGWDELAAAAHPEWIVRERDGTPHRFVPDDIPRWIFMDLDSPYLDYVMSQIEEVVTLFPELDGLFLDIIKNVDNFSVGGKAAMRAAGLDSESEADRSAYGGAVIRNYLIRTDQAAHTLRDDVPVFHNQGLVPFGNKDYFTHNSHVEIENLPTAGWGYDHFPFSAAYVNLLEKGFLGMTGKFHTSWGEMGGFKHPDALRFECAIMNAYGGNCSIGDHLPPDGTLDAASYRNIGAAYSEVEAREPWFKDDQSLARIAVIPAVIARPAEGNEAWHMVGPSDVGVSRILLESQLPFDVVDLEMDWSRYDLLVLADSIRFDDRIAEKVAQFLSSGGRILASGESGLDAEEGTFRLDIGADYLGEGPDSADYIAPVDELMPEFSGTPMNLYLRSQQVRATAGQSLGKIVRPYFDQSQERFCGHLQTPADVNKTDRDCAVLHGKTLYLAHPVFTVYHDTGSLAVKRYVEQAIRMLLGADVQVESDLPMGARITLREQPKEGRAVLHVQYAFPQLRGGFRGQPIEVVQELPTLANGEVSLRLDRRVRSATVQPSGHKLELADSGKRQVFKLGQIVGFTMIELAYEAS